jgi:hypothetical protein
LCAIKFSIWPQYNIGVYTGAFRKFFVRRKITPDGGKGGKDEIALIAARVRINVYGKKRPFRLRPERRLPEHVFA